MIDHSAERLKYVQKFDIFTDAITGLDSFRVINLATVQIHANMAHVNYLSGGSIESTTDAMKPVYYNRGKIVFTNRCKTI